jgi:hypothetical protein
VGCIFGELINNSPIFPGENDIDQLGIVIRVLGTPNEQIWPGVKGNFSDKFYPWAFAKCAHTNLGQLSALI